MSEKTVVMWVKRIMLFGFSLGAISIALTAWFDNPPVATSIFYIGIVFVGLGVILGNIQIARNMYQRNKNEKDT